MKFTEIQLSEKDINYWQTPEKILGAQAREYLKIVCNIKETTSSWRTYSDGVIEYTRKDGKPIQPEDIDALKNSYHDSKKPVLTEDGMKMIYRYGVDSSG